MKINSVIITITNVDEENAIVRITTDPVLSEKEFEDVEDCPASELGSQVWQFIQHIFEDQDLDFTEGSVLQ